ncbi:hypothetical protein [Bremerella cremea]|nr:hypothetical protein [Bremerella cremea]
MSQSTQTKRHENEIAPVSPARWRLRFSILSLMLLLAVVGLAISNWQISQKLIEAKEEVAQLRRTHHLLAPADPAKIQVLLQETNLAGEWQWRIALPAGDSYEVACQVGSMPQQGFPSQAQNCVSLPGGEEFLVTVRLQHAGEQKWETTIVGTLIHEMGFAFRRNRSLPIPDEDAWWMQYDRVQFPLAPRGELFKHPNQFGDRVFYFKNKGVFDVEQISFPSDKPVVLFEQRVLDYDEKGNPTEAKNPSDGMMIWLQRSEEEPENDRR